MIPALAALAALALHGPLPLEIQRDVPCPGCMLIGSTAKEKQPLVVVLHGDEGSPRKVASVWAPLAEKGVCKTESGTPHACKADEPPSTERRAFRVLAPLCPKSEGCAGSYWRWEGDVAWVFAQVDRVDDKVGVDSKRLYVAGWSGGSTYIGLKMEDWFPRAAALSIAGGGAPPRSSTCFPDAGGACAPIHYLMGDKNPLYDFADRLHRSIVACKHDLDWELVAGANHASEWRAYERRAAEIAWWLLDHEEGCMRPAAEHDGSRDTGTPDPSPSSVAPASSSPADSTPPKPPSAVAPPPAGCSCEVGPPRHSRFGAVLAFAVGVLRLRRKRRQG